MLTLADLRLRARQRLDDLVTPYLWSDAELLDCINDTLWDAAVRANLTVEDDIALPFTQKVDLTWNDLYALSSGILEVKSVYLNSQPTYTLQRTSIRRREQFYGGRPSQKGTPWAYALDLTKAGTGADAGIFVRSIKFISTPVKADTAYMDVVRLPKLLSNTTDVPEIDPLWQPDLIFGVTGLAYMKPDVDTYDPKRSGRDMQLFTDRFGERLPAVVIRERQTEVPYEMILG